jgi:hypothetical protein
MPELAAKTDFAFVCQPPASSRFNRRLGSLEGAGCGHNLAEAVSRTAAATAEACVEATAGTLVEAGPSSIRASFEAASLLNRVMGT